MTKSAALQLVDGDGLEAQERRLTVLQLRIDLCGKSPRSEPVGADTWPAPPAVVVIAQVPDLTAQVGTDAATRVAAEGGFETRSSMLRSQSTLKAINSSQ